MNAVETYFQVLVLFIHASLVGTTHEGVASYALVRLMGQTRARAASVVPRQPKSCRLARLSRANCYGVTNNPVPTDVDRVTPCQMTRLMKESRQPPWRDSRLNRAAPPFLFLPPLFLHSFSSIYLVAVSLVISSSLPKS
jgi:hypothetical protein